MPLHLPRSPLYDAVCAVDFETYYDDVCSLRNKKLTMTDYIRHPDFEVQSVSVWLETWDAPKTVPGHEAGALLRTIDWDNTGFLAHHTHFDGLIAAHHFGILPCFWLDTMSMARLLHGVDVSASLDAVSQRYGFKGKEKADALKNVKGVRLANMSSELLRLLMEYNGDDTFMTMGIFEKMAPYVPEDEMRIIDLTLRMYCEPLLELDEERLRGLHAREVGRRAEAVAAAGVDVATLGSAQRFADHLRSLGVEPPMKISGRTGQPTYAFAKNDLAFKELESHPDPQVVAAVKARLSTKSALVENRSQRLLNRVGLPTPMYYAYAAAKTLRWGGGDSINWQNLPRRGDGAEMRKSLMAPKGHKLIIADAAQIEARMVAWRAEHHVKLDAFARDMDTYAVSASGVYGFEVNKDDHPDERFAGKVLDLSCQYGAGAAKVSTVFRLGIMGPAIDMSLTEARDLVNRWRTSNRPITDHWKNIERAAERAWLSGTPTEFGPLGFELFKGDGYIHLPNGTYMKYPQVGWDPNSSRMYYNSRNGATGMWGGYLTENEAQALSCVLLKQQMLRMVDQIDQMRIVATTHDEVVLVVREDDADEVASAVKRIMSTPEEWAKGIPLNADVKVSDIYDKA